MMYKKAQITMETILIYGIIAIVVLTGIGALIYFGVFDLGSYLPDKCSFVTGDIDCDQWVANDGQPIQFGLKNNMNLGVDVISITLTQPDGMDVFVDGGGSDTCTIAPAGGVTMSPKNTGAMTQAGICVLDGAFEGQKIKFNMVATYRPTNGVIDEKASGEFVVKVQ